MKWFSVDHQGSFSTHATAEEAKAAAEGALDECRDQAGDETGWPDETDLICWGEIRERAQAEVIHVHDAACRVPDDEEPPCGYELMHDEIWEYTLVPAADVKEGTP
jgi:hypothetical protein